jgi:S1-C subfamily serine protease
MIPKNKMQIFLIAGALLLLTIAGVSITTAQDEDARPFLGVAIAPDEAGALVQNVMPESAAEEAGLEAGDIITAVNGEAITAETLAQTVQEFTVGDEIELDIQRGEDTLQLNATLAAAPEMPEAPEMPQMPGMPMMDRPFIGVQLENTDDGVTVREVIQGSPAEEAGLQAGDVITAVNGDDVTESGALVEALTALSVGDTVTLDISRDGEAMTFDVTLGQAMPMFGEMGMPPFNFDDFGQMMGGARLGVEFESLTAEIAEERELDVSEGALITAVQPESPAAEAGLQVDDVVTAVNGEPVDEERTLRDRLIAYEAGDVITLDVLREGESLSLEATMGEFEGSMSFSFGPDGMMPMPFGDNESDMMPEQSSANS